MAMQFGTPLVLVFLACIFKQKWNPVSGNHNPNVTRTIFSLSVIKEPAIRSIWCSASFDRQLHIHFTRWRRYYYGIRQSLTSLLILGGDIELNPGPAQKKERIENMYIYININVKQERIAHVNVRSVASHENFYLLKQTVTTKNFDIFTVSESSLDRTVCDSDILIPGYTTSGRIEGRTREAAEYSSMSKTRPASLKNGPQYLKATINNYG